MDKKIGVAVFGMGRAGAIHFRSLFSEPRAEVLYIVELDKDRVNDVLRKYRRNEIKVVDTAAASTVYEDPRVEAVIVCTPTNQHEDIVRKALHHGKSVFCEKPIGQDINGTISCYSTAKTAQKVLHCSFNRRFDPNFLKLRTETVNGKIGQPYIVKICARDNPSPSLEYLRISGGIFHDMAVHDIDMACWLLQDTPVSVFAIGHAHIDGVQEMNDVDTVVMTMKFDNGAIAIIDICRQSCYGYDQRAEVFGPKGMLIAGNQRPTEVTSYLKDNTALENIHHSTMERYREGYAQSMRHFLNVIEGIEEPSVSAADTINVSIIAAACEKSWRCKKPVLLTKDKDGIVQEVNE